MNETAPNTPRTPPALSRDDLLSLICQLVGDLGATGMPVLSTNHNGALVIVVRGAERVQDMSGHVRFVSAAPVETAAATSAAKQG
jgi:hypothetical protein